jgi:predicted amidohydrolase YtcJ
VSQVGDRRITRLSVDALSGRGSRHSYVVSGKRIFAMTADTDVMEGYMHVRDGMIVEAAPGPIPAYLSDVEVLELGDAPVVPGFVDPHIHLEQSASASYGSVDCQVELTDSVDAILDQLREHRDMADARDGWLIGQSNLFMDRRIADGRFPNRYDLDKVSDTLPVVLRCGSHVSALNTVALQRLQQRNVRLRSDASIELDDHGQPNGLVHELFHELGIPPLGETQLTDAIRKTTRRSLTMNGVTTIGEITDTRESLETLAALTASGDVPQRVNAYPCVPWTVPDLPAALGFATRDDLASPRFIVDGVKIFVDGGFSAGGAAVLTPYVNANEDSDHSRGRLGYTEERLVELIRDVDSAGLRLVAHTNGERAQRLLCSAAMKLPREGAYPLRLEHAGNYISDFRTLEYWEAAGAMPVAQASFIWLMAPFLTDYLGDEALKGRMPFATLRRRGIRVAFASDATGSEPRAFKPLFNMQSSMTRVSCTGAVIDPDEALDFMTTLRMHTTDAARAMGLEDRVGSIQSGAHADFLVLSADPTRQEPSQLSSIEVVHMFVGGVPVASGTSTDRDLSRI